MKIYTGVRQEHKWRSVIRDDVRVSLYAKKEEKNTLPLGLLKTSRIEIKRTG
jgi:hypothetical protein